MKVSNMTSKSGSPVANQFIMIDEASACDLTVKTFQSYDSVIVEITYVNGHKKVRLDERYWNYSTTTSKYRNQFLGETTKETQAKIDSGEYILTDLN
mgnify:CR=1 FL=1